MPAPLPENEAERLCALRDFALLDTDPEEDFDDFTRLAAHICGTPIALISLVDEHRQWFKSRLGLAAAETPREVAFCAHALHEPGLFLVPDAAADPRFADNPLVTGDPHVQFYGGAPLLTAEGYALGTLCVIDHKPRTLTEAQEKALAALARQVVARMGLRRELFERAQIEKELRISEARKAAIFESSLDCIVTIDCQGKVIEWNPAAEWTFGYVADEAIGQEIAELIVPPSFRDAHRQGMSRFFATGEGPVLGKRIEITAMRAGGEEFPVELAITPIALDGEMHFTACLRDISARKRAEQTLSEQDEQYRLLFENATHGIYSTTPDGRILLANPALLEMLGYDNFEQLATRNLESDGTEAAYARAEFKARLEAAGELRGLEATWERCDGRQIFVRENARLVRGSDGLPLYYEGSVEDITARKEAEEALQRAHDELEARVQARTAELQESEARYQRIASNLPGMVFQCVIHPDGAMDFPFVSEGCREIYALEPWQITENPALIVDIIHAEDLSSFIESVTRTVADLTPWKWEGRILTRQGYLKWVQGVSHPERQPNGDVICEGLLRDVTERRHAQDDLTDSETRYRSLVEHCPEAIIVYSENRIVYANAATVTLFAATCSEALLGRLIFDFVHPDYHALTRERARRSQEEGKPSALTQQKYVRLDGEIIDVESVSTAIIYQGKRAGQVLIRDITEQKRAEEQIRATGDMLQLIMDNIPQFIFWKDAQSVYQGCNRNFAQAAGLSHPDDIRGKTDYEFPWTPEEAAHYRAIDRRVMDNDAPELRFLETQRQADGRQTWLETNKVPLHDAQGRVVGILGTFQDYTEKKQAEEQIIALNTELTQAYNATIEGWSRALDLRDRETQGHSLRVTEMTVQMARAMGISDEELVHVRRGALLHDIGKMGVPDHILLKPGTLTEDEWIAMRSHPDLAYQMLSPIAFLRPALDIPYCHHEKWNGSGYPRGLSGSDIPLAARIFALVDVWDALCSDRPYRKAWPTEKVRDHICRLAGSHFDPEIVQLFLAILPRPACDEKQLALAA